MAGFRHAGRLDMIGSNLDEPSGAHLERVSLLHTQSNQTGYLVHQAAGDSKQPVRKHERGCSRQAADSSRKDTASCQGRQRKSVACRLRSLKRQRSSATQC